SYDKLPILMGIRLSACLLLLVLISAPASARAADVGGEPPRTHRSDAAATAILPPALPWDGPSKDLALAPDSADPWITPAERDGLLRTPGYDETVAWLRRLVDAAPELSMHSIGRSTQGREIYLVIASADGAKTPEAVATSTKPVVLAQAGIHSGEIDGKDAGLMLLRDMTVRGVKEHLLSRVNFLFVPILNVDGHERSSRYSRINQRGPEEMGWRTTARNLNLNRDYAKAESPEMRAMLRVLNAYRPDLYVDLHVTDGIDYQYDITWGNAGPQTHSPAAARFLEETFDPAVAADLEAAGHIPGYLVFGLDPQNPDQGLYKWSASGPRFSDGYGGARHLPTILVENHSLKPYPQRVLGTYVFLESTLETVAEHARALRRAVAQDRERRPDPVILAWAVDPDAPPEVIDFKGVAWRHEASDISGARRVVWLGEPVDKKLPRIEPTKPVLSVPRARAYWVPATWREVIERLAAHGVDMEIIHDAREVDVEVYRVAGAELEEAPFEGRARVKLEQAPEKLRRQVVFPPGSARVPTDQPLGDLAALLLEPQSDDSFFQWGFFLEVLSRTEYVEAYVMEPMAERMLAEDPTLAEAFEKALADDPELAGDPRARLQWFYRRTPFFDDQWRIYPVAREMASTGEAGR
ncbi:MAG: M14 family metallopeptidase, partial [Acidobacteriota bacterium]